MVKDYWPTPITGIIIGVESDPLRDLRDKAYDLYANRGDGAKYLASSHGSWHWPNRSKLLFRPIRTEDDADKILGHTNQFVGFNELSQYSSPDVYNKALVTLNCDRPDVHCKSISTTNPYGEGRDWIEKLYIEPQRHYGDVVKVPITIGGKTVYDTQVALFSSFIDNPKVTLERLKTLYRRCQDDPERYKAWVLGSWESFVGGAFRQWDNKIHVLDEVSEIPSTWRVDESMDWGSTNPCAVLWWAEVGDETQVCKFKLPIGSLILIDEWYIARHDNPRQGLELQVTDVAAGILERREILKSRLLNKDVKFMTGIADKQIFANQYSDVERIADIMARNKVYWNPADQSPNSRSTGKQMLRERLGNSVRQRGAGIYFSKKCVNTIDQIPKLQNHKGKPEEIADGQLDHIYDAIRYRLMRRPKTKAKFQSSYFG